MKTRPLGRSGIETSVVGFGAWAIGGWTWGGTNESESIRAIHAFLDAGGSLIDTAPVYGFGRSEEIVGKAIADRRDRVVLATKCGMRWDLNAEQLARAEKKFSTTEDDIDWSGSAGDASFSVYIYNGRDGIREEVERSLQRLKTDVIDLYQTHWQGDDTAIQERMEALEELRKEGKIRAIGVSNATVEQIQAYSAFGQVDVDQEKYSMLDRNMEHTNLPFCHEQQIAFFAYSPLGQGLLTGRITADRSYEEGDQRRFKERFNPENVQEVQRILEPVQRIARRHEATCAQVTIAWTLAQPGCSHALCGARTPQQAIENARAGAIALSEDELNQIRTSVNSYAGV